MERKGGGEGLCVCVRVCVFVAWVSGEMVMRDRKHGCFVEVVILLDVILICLPISLLFTRFLQSNEGTFVPLVIAASIKIYGIRVLTL